MLVLKNCDVFYKDKKILSKVNLELSPGLNLLVGPNGSGKSTLLNAIGGVSGYLLRGEARFGQKDLNKMSLESRVRNGIILIPQHLPKNTYTKLKDFIEVLSAKKLEIQCMDILQKFLDRKMYKDFSGGEAKLVDFYIALSLKPKLLLVDEIDSGLDLNNIKKIAMELKNFINGGGTILLVSHHREILNYLPSPVKVFSIKEKTIIENSHF